MDKASAPKPAIDLVERFANHADYYCSGQYKETDLRLQKAKSQADKESLKRQIAATDRQIDALVYELYGLTNEEIRIVEGDKPQ